ncbi:hypothetical protein FHS95_000127 [Sphingomonas naasensis]|uniref:Uncharacterized protein n=1 Tax=Sphingomonas naasensis TaxID=1344951 RepID=A0A4S1WQU2_9SPHN|nr:hypothetical protein [Sphingomonas naasensis]NIJ18458.1 hypothetical protein [Sphingomonas naasensis]TGX45721.1 hypothetical protein E5A74_00625 [Sphingomonas naasensis]
MATASIFHDVAPWPEAKADPNPRAVIGGNVPPLEERIHAEFRDALLSERADFMTLLDQLLGKANPDPEKPEDFGSVHRAKCDNDETLGRCGELVKRLRACEGLVSAVHVTVKKPYLDAGRAVDAEKNALTARIGAGRARVQGLMDDYANEQLRLRREREAEEAAQRAKLEQLARENNVEAALPPAAPAPVRSAPVRSDGGATVSLGTEHVATVTDYAKAFKKVKDDAKVREAIDAAIQRVVKAAKGKIEIPGVDIAERAKTSAR